MGRFLNADALTSTGQGLLGNNMFAYCRNNPVSRRDMTGCYDKEAYDMDGDPSSDEDDLRGTASTGSMHAGGATQTPKLGQNLGGQSGASNTNISSLKGQLQAAADKASASVLGSGPIAGTMKHKIFSDIVKAFKNPNVRTEVSFKDGAEVPYGTKGSVRFDVVYYENNKPAYAWDYKTGSARLPTSRINDMLSKSGLDIPIDVISEVKR